VFVECLMSGAHHEIRVKDQGPGFAAEDFPKLFSLNSKLSAVPTGDEVSTGIGLYSVKLAVDSFQGQISIVNNPDRGACVSILFPRHADLGAGLPPC
jgi:signal transduction histidine kinase